MSDETQPEERLNIEQLVAKIKGLFHQTALIKIEIGELLNEYTAEIDHGDKDQFYKDIGIKQRTAQHYKKIASNEEVQRLRTAGELDGLNMTDILILAGMRGVNNDNAPEQEYEVKGYGVFEFNKRHKIKIFQAEYEKLNEKVSELEEEIAELRSPKAVA